MWRLLAGCLVFHADLTALEAQGPEAEARVGAGVEGGVVHGGLDLAIRASDHGAEVSLAPMIGVVGYSQSGVGASLDAGVTLIGGGTYAGRGSVLLGGPRGELAALVPVGGNDGVWFLTLGARGGLDVRLGRPPTPWIGGFAGVNVLLIPTPPWARDRS